MGAALNDRLDVVRAMIELAPDSAIGQLDAALRSDPGARGLDAIRAVLDSEIWERKVREGVFWPVLLLCAPRSDGFDQILFPRSAIASLWRALKHGHPHLISAALASPVPLPQDVVPLAYDQLCREAAKGLREGGGDYAPVIAALDTFRQGAAAQFVNCIALAPLARDAAPRLPVWIKSMTPDHIAAVRLLFKDAVAVAPDSSPTLMEMLQAQLREPWKILRIVAASVGRGSDRYVADSEMAGFGERLLNDIDRHLDGLRAFDMEGGPEAAVAAAHSVASAVGAAAEFEAALEVDKRGPWGVRLGKQKSQLAGLTEGYLKKCAKLIGDALPVLPIRPGCVRGDPRLDTLPDERMVRRAMAGATFFDRVRGPAASGGYGTVRTKVCEEVTYGLDGYLKDLLAILHSGEAADMSVAHAYLEVGADFMGLIQDLKSAQIIRRRAASAAPAGS
jgi:hypothetical protein